MSADETQDDRSNARPADATQAGGREARLDELIAAYLRAVHAGVDADQRVWLNRYPDLAPELAEFFADRQGVERFAEPLRAAAAQAPPMGSRVGYVGDYELLEELGRGGMGVVYKARQTSLKRTVALKMILAGRYASLQDMVRFRAEAEAVARLQHPNIVQIHEIGEHHGHPYAALEFVEGGSLDRKLAGTPLPPSRAVRLLEVLALAIHAAHRHGVVHRDLKPANILLAPSDRPQAIPLGRGPGETGGYEPKVADFGLAKLVQEDQGQTRSGSILGTPSYMAPEQAAGKAQEVGPPADIYALGAILYELLTGRPPFKAETPLDTMMQVVSEEPVSPRQLNPSLPRDLETICLTCLQKDLKKRYPNAEALADDLRRFLDGRPIQARPTPAWERAWKWARRRPAVAALLSLVVLVTALGLAGVIWKWQEAERARRAEADQRMQTQAALTQAETSLYFSRIAIAGRFWSANDVEKAHQMLEACPPALRGWEWRYLKRLCRADLLTVDGHGGAVVTVAFSPDGRQLASASWEFDEAGRVIEKPGEVKVCDATTGRELFVLRGHAGRVNRVAFHPGGQSVASASTDHTVKLWDLATGRELITLRGHAGAVNSLAFSPDGKRLVSGSADETAKVWDVESGREVLSVPGAIDLELVGVVDCVAFSPDGNRLAVASSWERGFNFETGVKVWDATTGREIHDLGSSRFSVTGLAFSPDGKRLAATMWDGPVTVWDAATGQTMLTRSDPDRFHGVAWSPDGQRLALASADRTVKVWDASTYRPEYTLRGHAGPVRALAFRPDGKRLASASQDRTVKIWDVTRAQDALVLRGDAVGRNGVAFSPDGRRVAGAGAEHTVRVWDASTGDPVLTLKGHANYVHDVAFSPDGRHLASASDDGTAKVWEATTGQEVLSLDAHPRGVADVAYSPDAWRIATTGADQAARVWDARTGNVLLTISGAGTCVAFSPDGSRLASVGWADGKPRLVKVWDAKTGAELLSLGGHLGDVEHLAFSPDGRHLASASQDQTVKVWDATTGREVLALRGHIDSVYSVAFSPDGRRLASAGRDKAVRIWDAATGQEALTLPGHTSQVWGVAFSPDGRRLASADHQQVWVWDAPPPDESRGHAGPSRRAQVGRSVVTGHLMDPAGSKAVVPQSMVLEDGGRRD